MPRAMVRAAVSDSLHLLPPQARAVPLEGVGGSIAHAERHPGAGVRYRPLGDGRAARALQRGGKQLVLTMTRRCLSAGKRAHPNHSFNADCRKRRAGQRHIRQ